MNLWFAVALFVFGLRLGDHLPAANAGHEPKGGEPGLVVTGAEFYNPDLVRFGIQNPSHNRPIIGPPETQEPVIVRFEWRDTKGSQVLHTVDVDLTDALRSALNAPKTSTVAPSYRFDSIDHPEVHEMLHNPAIARSSARRLRITVDANDTVREPNEDNAVVLERPFPDLWFFGGAAFTRNQLVFSVIQTPATPYLGDAHALRLRFTWLDRDKNPMGGWRDWDAAPRVSAGSRPGLHRIQGEPALLRFDSQFSRDGIIPIRQYLEAPPPGSRFIRVEIDPTNVIPELRDDNNQLDVARPLPDLVLRSIDWVEYPDDGRTYPLRHVSLRIRNTGTALAFPYAAGGNIGLRFSWRDRKGRELGQSITWDASPLILTPDFQRTGNAIFHSASTVSDFRIQRWLDQGVPPGTTQLRIELDVLNLVEELNENNTVTHVIRPEGSTKGAATSRTTLLDRFIDALLSTLAQ